jgi:hypothetical protein
MPISNSGFPIGSETDHLPNFPALFFADDQVGFLALRNRLYPSDFLACACKRAAAERARNGLVGLSSRSSIQPPRLRRFVAGIDECECPQPRKLVADAAHLGVNFSDHVLELIGHFIPLALRLGSGASKAHEVAALHWRQSFHESASC